MAATPTPAAMRELVDLTRRYARKISNTDECESDALFGLTKALQAYDPDRGASLRTYALHRVHGEILDGFRERDHLSRSDRTKVRDGLLDLDTSPHLMRPMSLSAVRDDSPDFDVPDPGLDWEQLLAIHTEAAQIAAVWRLVDLLCSPRDAAIIHAYWGDGRFMHEIAAEHQMTESRVCQIVKKTATTIRNLAGVGPVSPTTLAPPTTLTSATSEITSHAPILPAPIEQAA